MAHLKGFALSAAGLSRKLTWTPKALPSVTGSVTINPMLLRREMVRGPTDLGIRGL
jgi:hypothetical protein